MAGQPSDPPPDRSAAGPLRPTLVLSGKETIVPPSGVPPLTLPPGVDNTSGFPVKSAAGDTIVNLKLGIRIRCGDFGDIYAGYGRALTGAFWYKNMFRVEYRYAF